MALNRKRKRDDGQDNNTQEQKQSVTLMPTFLQAFTFLKSELKEEKKPEFTVQDSKHSSVPPAQPAIPVIPSSTPLSLPGKTVIVPLEANLDEAEPDRIFAWDYDETLVGRNTEGRIYAIDYQKTLEILRTCIENGVMLVIVTSRSYSPEKKEIPAVLNKYFPGLFSYICYSNGGSKVKALDTLHHQYLRHKPKTETCLIDDLEVYRNPCDEAGFTTIDALDGQAREDAQLFAEGGAERINSKISRQNALDLLELLEEESGTASPETDAEQPTIAQVAAPRLSSS